MKLSGWFNKLVIVSAMQLEDEKPANTITCGHMRPVFIQ
ncbi:hypothetical protein BH20BAC1_BH20BAC1_11350 [soil metagenome]